VEIWEQDGLQTAQTDYLLTVASAQPDVRARGIRDGRNHCGKTHLEQSCEWRQGNGGSATHQPLNA
jgi:hypothetical protein